MGKEITLSDFFSFVLSKLKQILIFGIIGAIIVFAFVKFGADPTYTCTGTIFVNPLSNDAEGENNATLLNSEINMTKNLMSTYVELFSSKAVSEHLAEKIEEEYGRTVRESDIRSMTKYTATDDSLTIKFTCTSKYPETTEIVAKAIEDYAPSYVQSELIKSGEISTINSVGEPSKRVTNAYVMAMVAFMAIAIVVIAINLLVTVLDTRLKDVQDIADNFEYPVLGNIPNFYLQNKTASYRKHGGYKHEKPQQ